MKKIFFLLTALISLYSTVADAAPLTAKQQKRIDQAQTFLDNLKTLEAGFMQMESKTSQIMRGKIFISKPGKLRMRYEDPALLDFYLTGGRLLMYDYELEQLNHTDAEKTAFNVFLDKGFKIQGNLIFRIYEVVDEGNIYTIRMVPLNPDEVNTKGIALQFDANTNELTGFERVDADDNRFMITFVNTKLNQPIEDRIFTFKDPRKAQKYPGSR